MKNLGMGKINFLSNFFNKKPVLEFLCKEEFFGNIPEPYPSRKLIPDWYKSLPMKLGKGFEESTLKRCPPFLDAMTVGWIIPLAADVYLKSNHDCSHINYEWKFPLHMIQNHFENQVTSAKCPSPYEPKPPMKWMNHWAIKCPKGYSLLFVPPLNREDKRFTCFSGLVDADGYFEYVNFPFVWNEPNFDGIIPAGTPLMQVIPIKRETLFKDSIIRPFTNTDHKDLIDTFYKRVSHESHYRDNIWVKK